MTDETILRKAIEKAVNNGYTITPAGTVKDVLVAYHVGSFIPEEIIFSHDFAKAFWGGAPWQEWDVQYRRRKVEDAHLQGHRLIFEWQYHLQQLVLEENPLSYLEKFI